MNRYLFTSDECSLHVMPNQIWVQKCYPHEAVLVVSYSENGIFTCMPWIKAYENNPFAAAFGSMDLDASYLKRHYSLKQVL